MITFTKEQIDGMSQEEKNMLNDLAQRHHVEIQKDETERIKEHIQEHYFLQQFLCRIFLHQQKYDLPLLC